MIDGIPEFILAFDLFNIDVRVLFIGYYNNNNNIGMYFDIWSCSIFTTTIIMIVCYIYCIICMTINIILVIIILIIISS